MDAAPFVIGDRVRKRRYKEFGTVQNVRSINDKYEVLVLWDGQENVPKKIRCTAHENLIKCDEQALCFPSWANELRFSESQKQQFVSSQISHEFTEACAESDALQRTLGLTELARESTASKITVHSNRPIVARSN